MAMYALTISPLINKLQQLCPGVKQVWYANDATGASTCTMLRCWWDELSTHGPLSSYYPNPPSTHLVGKEEHEVCAIKVFDGTGVQITTEGKRHLGAAIGSRSFAKEYLSSKVEEWTEEIKCLAKVAAHNLMLLMQHLHMVCRVNGRI